MDIGTVFAESEPCDVQQLVVPSKCMLSERSDRSEGGLVLNSATDRKESLL